MAENDAQKTMKALRGAFDKYKLDRSPIPLFGVGPNGLVPTDFCMLSDKPDPHSAIFQFKVTGNAKGDKEFTEKDRNYIKKMDETLEENLFYQWVFMLFFDMQNPPKMQWLRKVCPGLFKRMNEYANMKENLHRHIYESTIKGTNEKELWYLKFLINTKILHRGPAFIKELANIVAQEYNNYLIDSTNPPPNRKVFAGALKNRINFLPVLFPNEMIHRTPVRNDFSIPNYTGDSLQEENMYAQTASGLPSYAQIDSDNNLAFYNSEAMKNFQPNTNTLKYDIYRHKSDNTSLITHTHKHNLSVQAAQNDTMNRILKNLTYNITL